MRMLASCEAITWPLVASTRVQERAAMLGAGTVCACAADINVRLAAMAANNFFMEAMSSQVVVKRRQCRIALL
ncbi:hypothetical protein GCM10027318_19700 [Massilia agilis]